jgi:hypothetical protein
MASYLGEVRLEILATARKHGIADEDTRTSGTSSATPPSTSRHQCDHELTMVIGPSRNGVTM